MNKRRIFGIITVIVIGLLAFAFANPNNTEDNKKENSEVTTTDTVAPIENVTNTDIVTPINNAVTTNVVAIVDNKVAEDLAAAKLQAINELNNYVLEANYSVNNWILVQGEITKGIANINAVTVIENVTVELNRAKTAIDAISTLAEDLAAAKLVAINELNNYVLQTDYSEANWVLVQNEITKGIANINAVTVIENVTVELNKAKTAIDAISTLAEDLAAAKLQAINELNNYVLEADYSEANWVLVQGEINKGIANINAVTVIENVTVELNKAKTAIDEISTLAEDLAAARKLAIDNLNKAIEEAEKVNSDLYTNTSYNELLNLVELAKELDLDSKNTEEIIDITNEILTDINKLSGITFDYITLSSNGKVYNRGETAETIIVTAHYNDSSVTKTVDATTNKNINTSAVVTNEKIVFTYLNETATYTYSVVRNEEDQKLESLTATLDKNTYELGSNDYVLTVTAKDTDGTMTVLSSSEYTITKLFSAKTIGENEMTVSYTKGSVTKTATVSYKVIDTVAPKLSLKGSNNIILTRDGIFGLYSVNYKDAGINIIDENTTTFSVTTSYAKPYSTNLEISNGINVGTKVGVYVITYTVKDASGNISSITRTVKVKRSFDGNSDISFSNVNDSKIEVYKNKTFIDDKLVTAEDLFDDYWFHAESLTVTSTNNVNMNKLGTYTVTYSATDWLGNTKTASRKVEIVDTTKPVITLLNTTRKVNYNSKTSLDIKNYTILDNYYNNLTADITYDTDSETNYICTKKVLGICINGYFETKKYITDVMYKTTDGSGNSSTVSYKLQNRILINN